ncbi:MAG: glycosyltransferase [Flavobacteriales bacterium]
MADRYVLVSPCFNEETVIAKFLTSIEEKLASSNRLFTVIVVDDCSSDSTVEILKNFRFRSANFELKLISLKYNVGHQNAIYQGLCYAQQFEAKGYIVLDSDGEDDPDAIKQLIEIPKFDIVFVSRGKRKESWKFKLGYFFYKLLFKIICGNNINFGNYSMVNSRVLFAICNQRYFHYSAFLSKMRFSKQYIQFDRQKRIDGKSKMNYNNLIYHGLKSLIEYSEEVLSFFLKLFFFLVIVTVFIIGSILYKKLISHEAIEGWASTLTGIFFNSLLTIIGIVVLSLYLLSLKGKTNVNDNIRDEIK